MNDDILISYLLGELSPEHTKEVNAWRRSEAAHDARFEQFKLIWGASSNLKFDGDIDAQESLNRLKQKISLQKSNPFPAKKFSVGNLWFKVAAILLVIVGSGLFYLDQLKIPDMQIATDNEVKIDTLSDGSVITLNKETILNYPGKFTGKQRNVQMVKGEAFFTIAHNKAIPFIIQTGGTTIRVVGTSFNVKNKHGNIEIIVETGIVQVSQKGNKILLGQGEKIFIKKNAVSLSKEKNPDQLYNYYRSKEFIADNTPLWRVVDILNEAYNSHIVIEGKDIANLPLNTTFEDESLDDILAVISRTFKVTVTRNHDIIIIK